MWRADGMERVDITDIDAVAHWIDIYGSPARDFAGKRSITCDSRV